MGCGLASLCIWCPNFWDYLLVTKHWAPNVQWYTAPCIRREETSKSCYVCRYGKVVNREWRSESTHSWPWQ